MTDHDDLEPRDRELLAWLGRHYRAPAETPARRAAFGEALRARLDARRGRRLGRALVLAAVASLVWLAWPGVLLRDEAGPLDAAAWEYELLLSSDVSPAEDRDEELYLPEEYRAIAAAFLGS